MVLETTPSALIKIKPSQLPETLYSPAKPYNDYSTFVKTRFKERVQKISVNCGFTCPNRDGSKGIGGCTYCNNNTFTPDYCKTTKTPSSQLEEGIRFFRRKNKSQKYLAYFQAYTNTYANIHDLKTLYSEALGYPDVTGLVIGTRPDCINIEIIEMLSILAKTHFISLEYGIESTLNRTLNAINRCHTYEETIHAMNITEGKGIHIGAHIMLNLPGESRQEMLDHAMSLSKLPINSLKIHQLQIVKHTSMAKQYKENPAMFSLPDLNEYIELLAEFVTYLRPGIVLERFISESPERLLIAPHWGGVKNYHVVNLLNQKLQEKNLWQGKNLTVNGFKL